MSASRFGPKAWSAAVIYDWECPMCGKTYAVYKEFLTGGQQFCDNCEDECMGGASAGENKKSHAQFSLAKSWN